MRIKGTKEKVLLLLALGTASAALAAPAEHSDIKAGNKYYKEEKYAEAEAEYRKALDKNATSFEANFNMGDALYKKGEYKAAMDYYKNAYSKENSDAQNAAVYHNVGNALLKQQQYQQSVSAYKESLKLNPDDNETRYNLAYAQKMLQQQQQQQNQQQQNQQQQNNDQQQDPNQGKQEENKQGDPNAQEAQSKLDENSVRQLLEALEQDEKDKQKERQKQQMKPNKVRIEKEW